MSAIWTARFALALVLLAGVNQSQSGEPPAKPPSGPPAPTTRASRPAATGGEALYLEKCAMCHADGGMGTGLLARRVRQPILEQRSDLDRNFVIQAARVGIGNMPAIPRGEVSDRELAAIADYLTRPRNGAR